MPKLIVQQVLPLAEEFEPIPLAKWTDEERKLGRCLRLGPPATFNFAERIYQIACYTVEGDEVKGKEAAARIGSLLLYLNPPPFTAKFDFPDGHELILQDAEYSELLRLLDHFPVPKHPAYILLMEAITNAAETSRVRVRERDDAHQNGHEPAAELAVSR